MNKQELVAYAEAHGLKRMGARPPLWNYLVEVWQRREFVIAMSKFANEAQNARTRLGKWWLILLPVFQATVYGLIFGFILDAARPDNFIPYLFTGVFLFTFISSSFTTGSTALTSNAGLIRSLSFPRMMLPLSTVIRQFLNLVPVLGLLIILVAIMQGGLKLEILYLPLVVVVLVIFGLGMALVAARLNMQLQDLGKLIPFANRVIFYTSGIFFSIENLLAGNPTLLAIAQWNPVYAIISLARGALVVGYEVDPWMWVPSLVWALGLSIVGTIYFWAAEERYGRD